MVVSLSPPLLSVIFRFLCSVAHPLPSLCLPLLSPCRQGPSAKKRDEYNQIAERAVFRISLTLATKLFQAADRCVRPGGLRSQQHSMHLYDTCCSVLLVDYLSHEAA